MSVVSSHNTILYVETLRKMTDAPNAMKGAIPYTQKRVAKFRTIEKHGDSYLRHRLLCLDVANVKGSIDTCYFSHILP